ncbi:MAG TPA: hypothetical protein VJ739_06020, partial [Gemmataceae bacterium]|nr:hypothetical protein [Gemmataceae bacterium]
MSWSFTAHAKSKEGLKRHSRQCLAGYHTAGSPGHKLMSALADRFDSMIDLFHFPAGKTVLM